MNITENDQTSYDALNGIPSESDSKGYATHTSEEKYDRLKEAAQEALTELERINKLIVLVNTAAIINLKNALV